MKKMKNLKKAAVILLAIVILLFTACGKQVDPKFYQARIWYDEIPDSELKSGVIPQELPKDLKELAVKICKRVSEYYGIDGIEKKLPKIAMLDDATLRWLLGVSQDTDVFGIYVPADEAIYLSGAFSEANAPVLAHEYLHYLSNNGEVSGLKYNKSGRSFGRYFNEGITNYLTYRLFPDEKIICYEYETHFAEQLAICVGEEVLEKAYFNSDTSELREIINKALSKYYSPNNIFGIELDVFDLIVGQIEEYAISLAYSTDETSFNEALKMLDSLEEEIFFLGRSIGKTQQQKEALKSFMGQIESVVPKTHLQEILEEF